MTATEILRQRNAEYISDGFEPVPEMPALRALILTCADPRVDPTLQLGLEHGDVAVVRNAGGRVTPSSIQTIVMMAIVAAEIGEAGGFELILLHHTDCGVARLAPHEELLASYFEIPVAELADKEVRDPGRAIQADLHALRACPLLPDDLTVSGLVLDVDSGAVSVAARAAPLRPEALAAD